MDPTRKEEGKFLKGCTPKAARRYATRGFKETSDNQEGPEAKFQDRGRTIRKGRRPSFRIGVRKHEDNLQDQEAKFQEGQGCRHCFKAPLDSVNVMTILRQSMKECRELRIREDGWHGCLASGEDLGIAGHPSGT
jgi:hypothetical protein